MTNNNCSSCGSVLKNTFLDLEKLPIPNNYLRGKYPRFKRYNLIIKICHNCFLVQSTNKISSNKIFKNYFYNSKYSKTWIKHCKSLSDKLPTSKNKIKVIEIGCNDFSLLNIISKKKNYECIGIDPASNIISINKNKNILFYNKFFNNKLSKIILSNHGYPNYIIGTNVIAHIPNINDFFHGIKNLFNEKTIAIFEFQYISNMLKYGLFDTIYHEHFYYYSLLSLKSLIEKFDLQIFDAKLIDIHGGSMRVYISKKNCRKKTKQILCLEKKEKIEKIDNIKTYLLFKKKVKLFKTKIIQLLNNKIKNNIICGYGAAAKGNTFLNFLNINNKIIKYIFDKSNIKNNLIYPGTDIKIRKIQDIKKIKPNYILILAWNISKEIIKEISFIKKWNGKFIIPFPKIKII